MMMSKETIAGAIACVALLGSASVRASQPVTDGGACEALRAADFSKVQDAATKIMQTTKVAAAGVVPAHCVVDGIVAPNVGFRLQLPDRAQWNGKFAQMAQGGYGGSLTVMKPWCDDALRRGYACIQQDTGHTGLPYDGTWAYNNLQAEFDYGIRAAHVSTLAGKAITQDYYSAAPKRSYFMGCSGGGKQALVQAQRYPWNYDGIVAVEPSNPTVTGTVQLWNALAMHDAAGKPLFTPADLQTLHRGAIAQCDSNDGLKDGIIGGDPRTCSFDPAKLACKAGQRSDCLSETQVTAAKKVYAGVTTSTGEKVYFPALPGSELGSYFTGGPTGIDYKSSYWRYMGFFPDPGPNWQPRDFDFDRDYKRTGMMDAVLVASDNPDLRKLKNAGGKLMIVQGWEDSGLPGPLNTLDYYEMVERVIGGREATQQFARLFMIPGRSHCRGGDGAAAIDGLSAIEAWVEQGKAPDMIVGAHMPGENVADFIKLPSDLSNSKFTRPHYAYPKQAKYSGSGDPNDYRNFIAVEPSKK